MMHLGKEQDMFITRFTRLNGNTEDYSYHTEKEAVDHLHLFLDDDSGLYKNIAILDDRNYVLHILPFRDGKPAEIISHKCIVRLRKEYASPEEIKRNHMFVVSNINENTERLSITCVSKDMAIPPSEIVGLEMVKPFKTRRTTSHIFV